ncbi:MAG: hypothetical protein HZC36_15915 [Armatimonadetes bacterium]|nr:hypothetical protein [Armatimonadota bacterium]
MRKYTLFFVVLVLLAAGSIPVSNRLRALAEERHAEAVALPAAKQFLARWGLPDLSRWASIRVMDRNHQGKVFVVLLQDESGVQASLMATPEFGIASATLPPLEHQACTESGPLSEQFARALLEPYVGKQVASRATIRGYSAGPEPLFGGRFTPNGSPYYRINFLWPGRGESWMAEFDGETRKLNRCFGAALRAQPPEPQAKKPS